MLAITSALPFSVLPHALPLVRKCSKKTFLFVEHFFSVGKVLNVMRVLPDLIRHPILSQR